MRRYFSGGSTKQSLPKWGETFPEKAETQMKYTWSGVSIQILNCVRSVEGCERESWVMFTLLLEHVLFSAQKKRNYFIKITICFFLYMYTLLNGWKTRWLKVWMMESNVLLLVCSSNIVQVTSNQSYHTCKVWYPKWNDLEVCVSPTLFITKSTDAVDANQQLFWRNSSRAVWRSFLALLICKINRHIGLLSC